MVVGEPVVPISRYPPSSVPVLSSVTEGVIPVYASASYKIVVMSLTGTNCAVLLGSSVQAGCVCGTSGIVLRVSQASSCVVASIFIAEDVVVDDLTSDVVNCDGWVCVVAFIFVGFGVIVDSPITWWSDVTVVIVVAVVVLCVDTVSFVVVNIGLVGLFVCVVLVVVVDAACCGVFVVRLMAIYVVVVSLVVGCLFVVEVYVVAWSCDVVYLLVVI